MRCLRLASLLKRGFPFFRMSHSYKLLNTVVSNTCVCTTVCTAIQAGGPYRSVQGVTPMEAKPNAIYRVTASKGD